MFLIILLILILLLFSVFIYLNIYDSKNYVKNFSYDFIPNNFKMENDYKKMKVAIIHPQLDYIHKIDNKKAIHQYHYFQAEGAEEYLKLIIDEKLKSFDCILSNNHNELVALDYQLTNKIILSMSSFTFYEANIENVNRIYKMMKQDKYILDDIKKYFGIDDKNIAILYNSKNHCEREFSKLGPYSLDIEEIQDIKNAIIKLSLFDTIIITSIELMKQLTDYSTDIDESIYKKIICLNPYQYELPKACDFSGYKFKIYSTSPQTVDCKFTSCWLSAMYYEALEGLNKCINESFIKHNIDFIEIKKYFFERDIETIIS